MRERALATLAIWMSSIFIALILVDSIMYDVPRQVMETVQITTPAGEFVPQEMMRFVNEPTLMPQVWQDNMTALLFVLIIGAALATVGVWRTANRESTDMRAQSAVKDTQAVAKLKYEQRERIARLLESMDDDEIAYIESERFQSLSDDGEIVARR